MSTTELFIYFVLTALAFIFVFGRKSRGKNYPPGPWGFPLVGHLPFLGGNPHGKLKNWADKYGPVFSLDFGLYPAVIVNDTKLMRTAFNDPDMTARPKLPTFSARSGGDIEGVILTDGKKWVDQRRFIIRNLRDFGFGKNSMEGIVQEEVKELIEGFRKDAGTPQTTLNRFNAAVVNALWTIVAGERFKQDDPELKLAIKHMTSNFEANNFRASISNFIPFLAKYFPKLSGFDKLVKDFYPIVEFLRKPINQHKTTFQPGQPRDLIDVYLEENEKTKDPESSFYKENGDKSVLYSVLDLFIAGAETTSTTLSWTFLYLAKFPEAQKKLQAEIDKVVGKSRLPSLSDRPSMPYAEAMIHEVMRFATIVPLGVVHSTFKEVELGGYTIPANTMIFGNQFRVHHDPMVWGDPENFRPERFLNEDGAFVKHESFMAFSVGKRACLGETLARDELFLFTTSLFQAFNVGPETTAEDLVLEGNSGIVMAPKPHKVILTERN